MWVTLQEAGDRVGEKCHIVTLSGESALDRRRPTPAVEERRPG